MMIKNTIKGITALIFSVFTLQAHAQENTETIKWKFQAHWPQGSSAITDSIEPLAEALKEKSNGRLELEIYGSGQIIKGPEVFNAVSKGVVPAGTTSAAYVRSQLPAADMAFGMPFSYEDAHGAAYFYLNSGLSDELLKEAEQFNVYYAGEKIYPLELITTKPINNLEDFKKLKIRATSTLASLIDEVGGSTVYTTGDEIYQSLANGVIDGVLWGAAQAADSLALYEAAKYHYKPAFAFPTGNAIIINKQALEALPEDLQNIVKETLQQNYLTLTNDYIHKENLTLNKVQEKGVKVMELPEDVQAALREAAPKVWEDIASENDVTQKYLELMIEDLNNTKVEITR